jgi:uncharacterized membrane protein
VRINDISALGWTHTIACAIALVLGFILLAAVKGTARHAQLGRCHFYLSLLANLTAVALPSRFPGANRSFDIFHWMALTVIAALVIGYEAASRQRNSPRRAAASCGAAHPRLRALPRSPAWPRPNRCVTSRHLILKIVCQQSSRAKMCDLRRLITLIFVDRVRALAIMVVIHRELPCE